MNIVGILFVFFVLAAAPLGLIAFIVGLIRGSLRMALAGAGVFVLAVVLFLASTVMVGSDQEVESGTDAPAAVAPAGPGSTEAP